MQLSTLTTYCAALPAGVDVDYTTMSKGVDHTSGLRYMMVVPPTGAFVVYSVNAEAGRLDLVGRGPENISMGGGNRDGICDAAEPCLNGSHSDLLQDSAGHQFLVVANEEQTLCGYSVFTYQLNKGASMGLPVELGGGMKRVFQLFRCGGEDRWVDFHLACAKMAPACVISTTSAAFNVAQSNARDPVRRSSHTGEVMVMRDNGLEIRRLAMHRSVQFATEDAQGYWSTPRAAISPDGAYVIADSNFGYPNQRRVIVIDTTLFRAELAPGNPLQNAASGLPEVALGVLATVYGRALTTCAVEVAAFPLPTTLCNTGVRMGGRDARVFSVTPEQVAFLIPDGVTPGIETPLSVSSEAGGVLSETTAAIPASVVVTRAPAVFSKPTPGIAQNTARVFDTAGAEREQMSPGEYAIVFAVGLGATTPPVALGDPSPMEEPLARLTPEPEIINDRRQPLLYAGLVPGMSGVYQLNLRIDPETPVRPDFNWMWLNVGGTESPRLVLGLKGL